MAESPRLTQAIKVQSLDPDRFSILSNKFFKHCLRMGAWSLVGAGYLLLRLSNASAAEFSTNHRINYHVTTDGSTQVTHSITLENLTPDHFAAEYTLELNTKELKDLQVTPTNPNLTSLTSSLTNTGLKVTFTRPQIGRGKKQEFKVTYTDPKLARKVGRLWEINLPAFNPTTENTTSTEYLVILQVPASFGKLHYSTPAPTQVDYTPSQNRLTFNLDPKRPQTISAVFGDYQVYNLTLRYRLKNPSQEAARLAIALPPDFLPYQKVYLKSLDPWPEEIQKDPDGNVLAYYKVDPQASLSVTYQGQLKIDGSTNSPEQPQSTPTPSTTDFKDLTSLTLPDKYWESNHPEIYQLAAKLQTPRAIYDYVTQNLTYNLKRLDKIPSGPSRLGAVKALENKQNAVCTEFTDLTIALLRAAGIPAREIDGYAYVNSNLTSNPPNQKHPTFNNLLHAWVMYYAKETHRWRQIDPTWGNTSGRDYFTTFDTNHLILTIKGIRSTGPYPTDDVDILPAETISQESQEFSRWLQEYNYSKLPWWKKLWLSIKERLLSLVKPP